MNSITAVSAVDYFNYFVSYILQEKPDFPTTFKEMFGDYRRYIFYRVGVQPVMDYKKIRLKKRHCFLS